MKICLAMGGFGEGGLDIAFLSLAKGFILLGFEVDFVLFSNDNSDRRALVPNGASVIQVSKSAWFSIPNLIRYFRRRRPNAVISAVREVDFNAVIAKKLSGLDGEIKLICTFHTHMTTHLLHAGIKDKIKQWLAERVYCFADHLVSVSRGVGIDMEERLRIRDGAIKTIFNPIWSKEKEKESQEPCDFEWLTSSDVPVIVAAGRFCAAKNFSHLLNSFSILRKTQVARLLILGDGEERLDLEQQIIKLGLRDDVKMPGFVHNPLSYFREASLFVLSSSWEGLPTVLIEALGCGLPIVSTDCKSGPREILDNGKYGELVPTNDSSALANAMIRALKNPLPRDLLVNRADLFSLGRITQEYVKLITGDKRTDF